MALDERLRRELDRAAEPADPSGIYEHLIRRRERRRIARTAQAAGLAIIVLAGTGMGVLGLSRVFGTGSESAGAGVSNGRIAFVNFEPGGGIPEITPGWGIYTMEPDGSDVRLIGPPDVDEALYPTYSPDGRQIAFAGFIADPEERGLYVRGLYVMDAGGGSVTKIFTLDDEHQIDGLAWSPDGSRIGILYTEFIPTEPPPEAGARDFEQRSTIWTIAPDGSELRQVTTSGREGNFSWNPDGTQVAFSRHEPFAPGDQYVANDIYLIDADGTNERQLTDDGVSMSPAWSPNGSLIAFASYEPDQGPGIDLYVMTTDGNGRQRVTSDPGNEYGATWSPDGTLIAYSELAVITNESSECIVSAVRPDGSDRTRLFRTPDEEDCPGPWSISWAPALPPRLDTATSTPSAEPTIEPTPTGSPSADAGQDIGLGFPVCNVSTVSGAFGTGGSGTAFVGTKAGDTGCPRLGDGFQLVAVDVSGDGLADASYGPLGCDDWCTAFAAPDIDGDGTDELLIQNIQFSIAGLRLYEVRADPAEVVPVTVATPGYPEGGLDPGAEPQFWLGGDGFNLDTLRCFAAGETRGRVLIQTSASQVPGDTPDSVWQATATWFDLNEDGTVSVIDVGTFEEPVDADPLSFAQGDGVCGTRLPVP